jgi:hypothetical protein
MYGEELVASLPFQILRARIASSAVAVVIAQKRVSWHVKRRNSRL